jgi:hypothetical protein
MRFTINRNAAVLVTLFACLLISCLESGRSALKGISQEESLNGTWRVTTNVDSDSCGLAGTVNPIGSTIHISQVGSSLDAVQEACCCQFESRWNGILQGSSMTLASVRTVYRDASCNLTVEENDVASLGDDRFSGEASLTISDAGGGCGAGFPCHMHATFAGTRCTNSECSILCAGIICPLSLCSGP